MKRNLSLWQFVGFSWTAICGTLLHFLYDWTRESLWAAPFSGVNESTWEHMKLLFVPLFLFALVQSRFFRHSCFWWIKLKGTLLGLVAIPVLFYTYNGAVGRSPDWLNIAIFFLSAGAVFLWETKEFKKSSSPQKHSWIAFVLLLLIGILFAAFTFFTPELGIFRDPLSGTYGIQIKETSLSWQSLFCFFNMKL